MWWLLGVLCVFLLSFLFEYRIRRPDQIVLYESKGRVRHRVGRFYPRHFSLSIPYSVYSISSETEADARGCIGVRIRLSIMVMCDQQYLHQLILVGGWDKQSLFKAGKELEVSIKSLIREETEKYEIEEITSEKISKFLQRQFSQSGERFGLKVISTNILSIEPLEAEISEAIRQRESARIRQQTEEVNQEARVAMAKARIEADERISCDEHNLEMKKISLRKEQEKEEAKLTRFRVEEEQERRKLQINVDQKEVEFLTRNPELLMLTPQLAQLAEASQGLRNAKTVVSVSGNKIQEESSIFQNLLSTFLQTLQKTAEKKKVSKGKQNTR